MNPLAGVVKSKLLDRVGKAAPKKLLSRGAEKLARDAWRPSARQLGKVAQAAKEISAPTNVVHAESGIFATIKGWVKSLLPDTNPIGGLPHQHFWFQEDTASGGKLLRVDNDLKFGTRVPDLAPGQPLTIRGQLWHDPPMNGNPAMDGIHWTHHRDVLGDAGFIENAAGQLFQ